MDDYMFQYFVGECREVREATSYLEVLNYTVSLLGSLLSFSIGLAGVADGRGSLELS